ncbi:IS200/IS605 family transposase [Candidatus Sumerlaeota bacterium]|nr:IS200/IS605 family transposase [Candidatus Sumerlaeota bacterium]
MSQSLSKILLHVVFSAKQRRDLIPPELREGLHAYLAGACREQGSHAYRVGGTENHVHLACTLPRTLAVADLLEGTKRSSSKWMKKEAPKRCGDFVWQNGYGAFSLGQSQLQRLIRYIDNQMEHHRKEDFKAELLALLDKYEVDYDEQYLWE